MPQGLAGRVFLGGGCWRPCLPAGGNWIQLPLAVHKGAIEAGGSCSAPAPAPAALHSSSKATPAPPGQEGAEPATAPPRQKKQPVQAARGGPRSLCGSGTVQGPPGPSPGLQPHLSRCLPASIPGAMSPCLPGELPAATIPPGHSCPFLPEETKVPFCSVGRAAAVATSDLAAGQSPTPLLSCPQQPSGTPRSATSPAHGPGGCASFTLGLCRKSTGDAAA